MLSRLQVSNYAIIHELDIAFDKGLNIITGETGAGKSILAGALGLILGDRADSSVLLDTSRKCVVEGVFTEAFDANLDALFTELDIESGQELILRREISANGKSRAFVNDTPVNLSQLQKFAARLVDLHRQFDALELGEDQFQMEVLDALAGQSGPRQRYAVAYASFTRSRQVLSGLQDLKAEALKAYDYQQFLLAELEDASFREGEIEELENELRLLSHAEQVNTSLVRTAGLLHGDEPSMAREIRSVLQSLEAVAGFSPEIQSLADRLRSVQIEVKDIAAEASRICASVNMDPKRRDAVHERLDTGNKLLRKHHVANTSELLKIQEGLRAQVGRVLDLDGDMEKAGRELRRHEAEADEWASVLAAGRRKVAPVLEKRIGELLSRVGMPNARLKVEVSESGKGPAGIDKVEFLFDANNSNRFDPLRKVASGGELSRLLLCVKTLVAGSVQMPVLIFDEIDTGISGEAARQVGILMKDMGREHQVIAITHQPQIAAKADQHFFVFKKELNGGIRTQVRKLDDAERVESIARMMAGEKLSHAALQSARELISSK
jgi:DNA repair protein RecN (Recombination protein N)